MRIKQRFPSYIKPVSSPSSRTKLLHSCKWEGCNYEASTRKILAEHAEKIHVNTSSDFICHWGQCTIQSERCQKAWLLRHVMQHIGVLPYPCPMPQCPLSFKSPESLSAHVESHFKHRKKEEAKDERARVLQRHEIQPALQPACVRSWRNQLSSQNAQDLQVCVVLGIAHRQDSLNQHNTQRSTLCLVRTKKRSLHWTRIHQEDIKIGQYVSLSLDEDDVDCCASNQVVEDDEGKMPPKRPRKGSISCETNTSSINYIPALLM
eukprot:gene8643-1050_t